VAQTRLDQLKGTPEPLVGHALQSTVGKLPPALALQVWNNAAFKTSLSCSNLAGPQRPMRCVMRPSNKLHPKPDIYPKLRIGYI
jgi:hypothetical protein